MLARKIFQAALLKAKPVSVASVAGIRNAPPLPQLSEDSGEEYDPRKESLESFLNLRFGPNFPTINDDKNPQRDLVNFPRQVQPDFPEANRLKIIPESWFNAFYEKTGVTGPYMFLTTFGTFLLSKEWIVFEHEMLGGIEAAIVIGVLVKMFGPGVRKSMGAELDAYAQGWDDWQNGMIKFLDQYVEAEKNIRDAPAKTKVLFDAKRENIQFQLEAEFRRRQMEAYNEVKRRLDYLVSKEEAERQFQQKHMVSWIIENAAKGITAQQEKDALKSTFADLKKLAATANL